MIAPTNRFSDITTKRQLSIYDKHFQHYADAGFQPRPVEPGSKAAIKGWRRDVPTIAVAPGNNYGIGLRLGTRFSDSTLLTAIDCDHDDFARLTRALVSPVCGRVGKKGVAVFARVMGECDKCDLKVAGHETKVGEFLGTNSYLVIPLTVHPCGQSYRWTDQPLLEVGWQNLPVVDPDLIKAVFASEHLPDIMRGVATHDAMLKFVGQLAQRSEDFGYLERVVTACFPEDYQGDSLEELPSVLRDTAKKFETGKWIRMRKGAVGFPDVFKDGLPRPSLPNTKTALQRIGVECRHDLFRLCYVVNGHELESYVGEVSDPTLLRLRELVYEKFGFDPTTETVQTALRTLANHARFHPVRDYLDRLVWDGRARIDGWLIDYAGAEDTPFVRAAGALVLVAAARRVREPGCKFDELLVLESPDQGTNKSSALRALAVRPEWFTDNLSLGLSPKETIETLSGHWIVEVGELQGIRKNEVERVKRSSPARPTGQECPMTARSPMRADSASSSRQPMPNNTCAIRPATAGSGRCR